ncbi:MAG TPA: radical SAM protein [Clostridia bacterium]|nr:radical SAM protein [Clostridia bacterium]
MNGGIKDITDTANQFYLGDKRGQAFMLNLISSLHKSAKVRSRYEKGGTHIPPFLISSIATNCNLHCTGCYARANGACSDEVQQNEMGLADWRRIFTEASEIGISFVLLAGGEPLMRRDMIELAAQYANMIFPIFTNGTMIDGGYLTLFDDHRNLIPVLSIEGAESQTDERRGRGVSEILSNTAEAFKRKGILYGVSVTVTRENKDYVTGGEFLRGLRERGCGLLFYVEYVPIEKNTEYLVLNENELQELQTRIDLFRKNKQNKGIILVSFPGDEEAMGGCLAAGRGFFHISANGGAEPCPFSPYSEMNLKTQSILEVLRSPFFERVRAIGAAEAPHHKGGCTLFQFENEVRHAL